MPRGRPRKVQEEAPTISEILKGEAVEDKKEVSNSFSNAPIPYEDLMGKLIVVKVGSDEKPASPELIKTIEDNLNELLDDIDCRIFVTYHNVELDIY